MWTVVWNQTFRRLGCGGRPKSRGQDLPKPIQHVPMRSSKQPATFQDKTSKLHWHQVDGCRFQEPGEWFDEAILASHKRSSDLPYRRAMMYPNEGHWCTSRESREPPCFACSNKRDCLFLYSNRPGVVGPSNRTKHQPVYNYLGEVSRVPFPSVCPSHTKERLL